MKLENLIFVAKHRKPWESVDLGFRIVPVFWRSLWLSWVALSLPVLLLCSAFETMSVYASLILWWLKPLFERTQLHILSHGVFGEDMSWRRALNSAPAYLFKQILPALTWRRISFTRAFDAPVAQLESLSGERRSKRLQVLHRDPSNQSIWLTIVLLHIETIIFLGLFFLIALFVPESIDVPWIELLEEQVWFWNVLYFVAIALVGPFYVSAGFMLYLNRRIELEGWDIELKFREIIKSQDRKVSSRPSNTLRSMGIALLALCAAALVPAEPTLAEPRTEGESLEALLADSSAPFSEQDDVYSAEHSTADAEACSTEACLEQAKVYESSLDILDVFEHEDFHQETVVKIPKWLDEMELDDEPEAQSDLPNWLSELLKLLAASIELIVWALVIALVVFLIIRYRSWLANFIDTRSRHETKLEAPAVMFGLDVRQENLPHDIVRECGSLLDQALYRECLSLLYRATISRLIFEYRVPFRDSNTELECLALSQQVAPEEVNDYFGQIVKLWRQLAYGHLQPPETLLRELSESWEDVLGRHRQKHESAVPEEEEDD